MRIFFDIETSPNVCYVWRTGYKLNVGPESIVQERKVICICYRFEGERRIHSLTWDGKQDDKRMLDQFCGHVDDKATELVAHNGSHFDLPWIKGRCVKHGLIFPDTPMLDTCTQSRRLFNLNSNRLAYLADYLGLTEAKLSTGYDLWVKCMQGSKSALRSMVTYCKQDVVTLQAVYDKLQPYLKSSVHRGVANGGTRIACPNCGSRDTKRNKRRTTAAGLPRFQLQCKSCGKYWTLPENTYWRELSKT